MTSSLKPFSILCYIKQIDSNLLFICSVIDHRGRQNVIRTSVTHSAVPRVPLFDVMCDLLLNRRKETWNLFVKYLLVKFKYFKQLLTI